MKKLMLVLFAFSAITACTKMDKTPVNEESAAAAANPNSIRNNDVTTNDSRNNTGHVGNNGTSVSDGAANFTNGREGAGPNAPAPSEPAPAAAAPAPASK